jgi:hypothetical protein
VNLSSHHPHVNASSDSSTCRYCTECAITISILILLVDFLFQEMLVTEAVNIITEKKLTILEQLLWSLADVALMCNHN